MNPNIPLLYTPTKSGEGALSFLIGEHSDNATTLCLLLYVYRAI